jgi:hypothetical protein
MEQDKRAAQDEEQTKLAAAMVRAQRDFDQGQGAAQPPSARGGE